MNFNIPKITFKNSRAHRYLCKGCSSFGVSLLTLWNGCLDFNNHCRLAYKETSAQ